MLTPSEHQTNKNCILLSIDTTIYFFTLNTLILILYVNKNVSIKIINQLAVQKIVIYLILRH